MATLPRSAARAGGVRALIQMASGNSGARTRGRSRFIAMILMPFRLVGEGRAGSLRREPAWREDGGVRGDPSAIRRWLRTRAQGRERLARRRLGEGAWTHFKLPSPPS